MDEIFYIKIKAKKNHSLIGTMKAASDETQREFKTTTELLHFMEEIMGPEKFHTWSTGT